MPVPTKKAENKVVAPLHVSCCLICIPFHNAVLMSMEVDLAPSFPRFQFTGKEGGGSRSKSKFDSCTFSPYNAMRASPPSFPFKFYSISCLYALYNDKSKSIITLALTRPPPPPQVGR